jgi:2-keto-4-pentenoate hydratase/2-oxohepta-3-ene-1,7-dioic acid hydratase in catechol pathway
MRIVHFEDRDGRRRYGVREGERIVRVSDDDHVAWDDPGAALTEAAELRPDAVRLLPPVSRPGKILCIGLNYHDHARETGHQPPAYPAVFMRGATSLVGPGAVLVRPRVSEQFDYEAELAVVIGRTARGISESDALDCVAGYSCFNDASLRDYQRKSQQWTMGKNFDATGAFGPDLVTPDELPAGASGLRVVTRVNGEILQDGNTADMIFSVPRIIAILAEVMTLEPGDVIITGTPAGVGTSRTPPRYLRDGDVCEVEIEGIGVLSNPVVDAPPATG